MTITDWIQALASVLTLLTAIAALTIASKAPRAAAKFAEEYQVQNVAEEEKKRLQMAVFGALMKCRRELLNADARAAVNMVDLAFYDSESVKEARRLFLAATQPPNSTPDLIVERYHGLLETVCRAMGFDEALRSTHFANGLVSRGDGQA